MVDPDGRDIGYTVGKQYKDKDGRLVTPVTVNVSIAVLDLSKGGKHDINKVIAAFTSKLTAALSGTVGDKNAAIVFSVGKIDVQKVNSADDVKDNQHLLTVVDDVRGKADPDKGGEAGGIAEKGGKSAFVEKGEEGFMAENMLHEFGHTIGLDHSWQDKMSSTDDGKNYMDYANSRSTGFTGEQLAESFSQYQSGRLNQGTGYQRAANNSYTIGQTTNEQPYRVIQAGQRMPKPVVNPNK
jgi:hypothetical protein